MDTLNISVGDEIEATGPDGLNGHTGYSGLKATQATVTKVEGNKVHYKAISSFGDVYEGIRSVASCLVLKPEPTNDIVNRPSHYTRWAIEPVEFLMRNNVTGHLFNIVKYAMRAGYKLYPNKTAVESEIIDLEKTIRYAQMRINLLNGDTVL